MIKAFMQVDCNNPLALKYLEHALKSFERVKDIFEIHPIQCITPDTLLDISFSKNKNRSPQEEASICSQYRIMKMIASGKRFWIMEHDAYLRPEYEDTFRMIMSKYTQMLTCNIGIAMECYTAHPEVAKLFCQYVENDLNTKTRGPMGILHTVTDIVSETTANQRRNVYWPKLGKQNQTGISYNVSRAFKNPHKTIDAPVTQLIDSTKGSTVTDRPKIQNLYTPESHPNFHFIDFAQDK